MRSQSCQIQTRQTHSQAEYVVLIRDLSSFCCSNRHQSSDYLQPSIYFITKGRCRVELETEGEEAKGKELNLFLLTSAHPIRTSVVAYLESGQMFGEISFLLGGKGTATVLAHEEPV